MNPRKDAAAVHDAGHGLHKIGIGGDDDDDAVNTVQGVLDYRDDCVQKKFPDNWNPDNRGYILYYSAQNDQKFPVIVRNV